ncbi:hypothetical protein PM082_007058 [Marasmius tenuissimus]|nr:hypothetical protein PM082_007058 [Marasmius tenuissimus]
MVSPKVILEGTVSESEEEHKLRLEQPIYLFARPPPFDLHDGDTSSIHYWSFQESGEPPLSPEVCRKLGLPKLESCNSCLTPYSWSTAQYQLIHQYQLLRGFDPATIDFARHTGYDDHIYRPINDSDQFEVVLKDSALVNTRCEPATLVDC